MNLEHGIEMPETLGVIAGRGTYPWQLARSAHAQGAWVTPKKKLLQRQNAVCNAKIRNA